MRRPRWIALPALVLLDRGLRHPAPEGAHAPHAADTRPVLYDSLGSYSYRITTASADAQRWFDQGLRLVYAFNHHEAQKAFREAARLDPTCAMCFWGIALTEGSNYNHPTDARAREARARRGPGRPAARAAGTRREERALIEAVAERHSADPAAGASDARPRLRRRDARGRAAVPRRPRGRHVLRRRHDEPPAVEPVDAPTARRSRAPRRSCRRSSACWPGIPIIPARSTSTSTRSRRAPSPAAPRRPPTGWRS